MVGAGTEVFAAEVLEFPNVFYEELAHAGAKTAYVFPHGGACFCFRAHGVFAVCLLVAADWFWEWMCS